MRKKGSYIMGDFNIVLLKSNSNTDVEEFLQINLSSGLRTSISKPTRITPTSKTLIDNIFTSNISSPSISGNIICSISDHLPQFIL